MGYLLAIVGGITGILTVWLIGLTLLPGSSDLQLIVGTLCGVATAVLWVGAVIIFRMDYYHSKKDTPQ